MSVDNVDQISKNSVSDNETVSPPQRYARRLSDKILIAFHHACDQEAYDVAERLLRVLEMMVARRPLSPDPTRRRSLESLIAAHERLWHLVHARTSVQTLGKSIELAFTQAALDSVEQAWGCGVPVATLDAEGLVIWVYPNGSTKPEFEGFTPTSFQAD